MTTPSAPAPMSVQQVCNLLPPERSAPCAEREKKEGTVYQPSGSESRRECRLISPLKIPAMTCLSVTLRRNSAT